MLIAAFISSSSNKLQAQQIENKLDQADLMKQFIGSWKCELGKDTLLIAENSAFGNGLTGTSQISVNGKILTSVKQLYGYDKKLDKFIVAELIESSPVIEICTTWFTSMHAGELIVTNPDNVNLRFKFEFKSPDRIVQTAILDDQVVKEITLIRIKSDK